MNTQHERTVYELIEANGLTLHGDIEHFAELVREDERELCAKVCDELRDDWLRGLGRYEFMGEGADYCADAIRARS